MIWGFRLEGLGFGCLKGLGGYRDWGVGLENFRARVLRPWHFVPRLPMNRSSQLPFLLLVLFLLLLLLLFFLLLVLLYFCSY